MQATEGSEEFRKSWNFPKAHSYKHAFADIRNKGATRNYNTKPNEKLHGPLKESYHSRTNNRDVAEQVRISFSSTRDCDLIPPRF